jgi:uncharacterized protein YkwD
MKKLLFLLVVSTLTFASTSAASQRDSLIEKIDQSMASQTYAQQVKIREGIKSKIIAASSKASDTSKFESILNAVNDHVADLKKNLENNQTSVKWLLYQQIREGVLNKTNEIRLDLDLQPLKLDDTLSLIAELYVGYIDRTDDFSHTTEGGVTFEDRIKTSGYPFALAGENLAKWYTDTDAVMKAWMESPAHKDNIVNPNFRDMWLAYKNGYRVQVFGIKTIQD